MKKLIPLIIVIALLLVVQIAQAGVLNDATGQPVEWNALYSTQQGAGAAVSIEVGGGINGFQQYIDAALTLDAAAYLGASTEVPKLKQTLDFDRIGFGIWAENDLAFGIVGIKTIK